MNILMIHPHDIYSDVEPWTVRIVYLAKEYARKGHKVKLVYFPLSSAVCFEPHELVEQVTVFPFSRKLGVGVLIANILKLYKIAGWAEVIHFQKCFYHAALPAVIAAFLRRIPLHYDWDDWEAKIYEASTQPGILRDFIKNFLYFLESTLPKVSDTVSVSSHRLRLECEKLKADRTKIVQAHVGADLTMFNPAISGEAVRRRLKIQKTLVLYLGQLHGAQYAQLFIEAASRLINDLKQDMMFMIFGDGYLSQSLKALSIELDLEERIIFTGSIRHEAVPEYLAAADVCVGCFEENEVTLCKSPLKIAEYMASGRPVVASNVGEVGRMLGGSGILTLPGDPVSLAEGILKLVKNDSLRKELAFLARRRAETEYNWTVTAENILDAYRMVLEKRKL